MKMIPLKVKPPNFTLIISHLFNTRQHHIRPSLNHVKSLAVSIASSETYHIFAISK